MERASDFRSDTVTRPTAAMREAMLAAELGDDVLDGDPTVARLERAYAEWVGKEGALFLPSGTMANQIAIGAWTRPGNELVAERSAHVLQWEAGAVAALHGVQAQALDAPDGRIAPERLVAALRLESVHCPRSVLLCVEQTFMGDGSGPGGRVVPREHLERLAEVARERGLAVHMDGARLPNAVVAAVPAAEHGVHARALGRCADSVMTSLTKGLGAPVGAVLAGPGEFLERARLLRKRFGGWMRQAGVIAAAGLHALEHHVERLADDHRLAGALAELFGPYEGFESWPGEIESNIVMVRVTRPGWSPERFTAELAELGVWTLPMSADSVRFVTHLDVGPRDLERLDAALRRIL